MTRVTPLACPDGHRGLRLPPPGSFVGAPCTICKGTWLPGAAVHGAIGRPVRVPEQLAGPRAARRCPEDDAAMGHVDHRGVAVEVCPRCGGVWLDAGELAKLQEPRSAGAGVWIAEGLIELLNALF